MSDVPLLTPSLAVFLSYARENTAAVQRMAEALRDAGIEVWFDQSELVGGDAWDAKLRGQIASCALFVPVISTATQARREGYFRLEWRLAAQRSHMMSERTAFLLPVVIDATRDAEADVPTEFKAVQWTRLASGEATPQFVERIKHLLARPPDAGVARPAVPASHTPGRQPVAPRRRAPVWIYTAAAVAVLATCVFFALRKPSVADKSIAVLPFANLGADKNDEYLGDGMTEELLNVFAKLPKLKVAARTSSFYFKGKNLPIAEVGKQLGVAFVLEGSVRKTGNKLRITTQLINASDGYHLWSETYDRDMTDLLAIQTEVSQKVVAALLGKLGVEESQALAKRATVNPEAHRLYLLGRFHFFKATQASWVEALRCFNDALRLDPNYALAYCGLADTYNWMGGSVIVAREGWVKSKDMAQKALALEPDLADAHLSLGLALWCSFEWAAGEAEIRRALALNPNLALAHDMLGAVLNSTGRLDEGQAEQRKAVELDPLSLMFNNDLAMGLYLNRRYAEALAQARRTMGMYPDDAYSHWTTAWALIGKGEPGAAVAEFRTAKSIDDLPWFSSQLGYALAVAGDRAGAEQVLSDLDEMAKKRFVNAGCWASVYLGLGEWQKALDWLEKAFAEQDGLCWNLKVDQIFDPLRSDPRFKALLKKVGLDR